MAEEYKHQPMRRRKGKTPFANRIGHKQQTITTNNTCRLRVQYVSRLVEAEERYRGVG